MASQVEGDGGHASNFSKGLINMLGIKSCIRRKIGGPKAKIINHPLIKRLKVGGVSFIKGLGVLGQDDIAIVRVGGGHHPTAIAPQIFFFDFDLNLFIVLITAALDGSPGHRWVVGWDRSDC